MTTTPGEVIGGSASIRGSNSTTNRFNQYLSTNPAALPLAPNQTYRITFSYRILAAPSDGFQTLFISQAAAAAGNPFHRADRRCRDREVAAQGRCLAQQIKPRAPSRI